MKLAVQRHLDDLERWQAQDSPYYFDSKAADRVIAFLEKLRHIKGPLAKKRQKITCEDWQCFIVGSVFGWKRRDGLRRFRLVYIEVGRKNAKALALDTPIPTPQGWSTMGELSAGDQVYGVDGRPCAVLATSEDFVGHDCYELTFSNGQKVTADAGHLWLTTARIDKPGGGGRGGYKHGQSVNKRIRTTEEIYQSLLCGARGDINHSVDMPQPINGSDVDLPIGPYTLGAWLGDGHSAGPRITFGRDDVEIVDGIQAEGYPVRDLGYCRGKATTYSLSLGRTKEARDTGLGVALRRLGLKDNKHIPDAYLRASFAQRLALLQGLMDTDGTVDKSGRVLSFTNTNVALVDGVADLLATLGIKFSWAEKKMTCNSRRLEGKAQQLQFMAFVDELPVFRLRRKLERMRRREDCKVSPRSRTAQIIDCKKVDSEPTRCIAVDSPDKQFLFGRWMLPTHNSTISSGVGLYMLFADGEEGAEVYSAATTQKQARIVFDDARRMALKDPKMTSSVGLEVMRHNINQLATNSKFEPLSAEGENLDGLNPHCSIVDELHAHRTREVFDVLESAMGAREQPLLWNITTAGSNRAGICYEQRSHVAKILQKLDGFEDETTFGIIYTIDDEDDWKDPKAWEKANPNYGVSVVPDDMERACRKAMSMPSALSNFLTKRLNVWVASDSPFYDMQAWQKCHQPGLSIESFAGQQCWIGMDFAERVDMAAMVAVFRHGEKGFAAFGKFYLPEDTIDASGNSQYRGWVRSGYLTATEGAEIDFQTIYDDLMDWAEKFDVQMVHFDPAYASQFMQQLTKDGVPNAICRPAVINFSDPMLDHQGAVKSGRFAHDGNPILEWMASNVVAHLDNKDNVYPRKERPEDKIDGIVALLMARNAMMRETPNPTFAFFEA